LILNENYIIEELIQIIQIFKKNNDIELINEIKNLLRDNANIQQQYSNANDTYRLTKDLSSNFEKIYDLIISNEEIKKDEQFYNELRYILFKEINKISDINYQSDILDKLGN